MRGRANSLGGHQLSAWEQRDGERGKSARRKGGEISDDDWSCRVIARLQGWMRFISRGTLSRAVAEHIFLASGAAICVARPAIMHGELSRSAGIVDTHGHFGYDDVNERIRETEQRRKACHPVAVPQRSSLPSRGTAISRVVIDHPRGRESL